MLRHFGVAPTYDGLQIVAAWPRRKAQYFDWTRIPCQFRVAKHRGRGYRDGRYQDDIPGRIQSNLLQPLSHALGECAPSIQEYR